jgi:hypothetical protein
MRSKWIDPRFIAPLIMTAILALGAVPAAATIETYNIIFTPGTLPAPSGSFTLDVTCTSCFLAVPSFDITDTSAAEWTPADPNLLFATVDGTGVVTSLDTSFGVIDSASPPAIPSTLFLGFGAFGPNTYNVSGSDPALAPDQGTYELQLAQLAAAPEPAASGLLVAGLAGYGAIARWRRRRISG